MNKRLGDRVQKGESLVTLHTGAISDVETAKKYLTDALTVSDEAVNAPPLVYEEIE
jgi:pyrimidine-nucleoside phosphorylase